MKLFLVCFLVLAATLAQAQSNRCNGTSPYPCTNGVFILAARGTDMTNLDASQPNPDFDKLREMQDIADEVIAEAGNGSYVCALPYPAATNGSYFASVTYGINAAQDIVMGYVNRCSNAKIILMGYSQGGQVMTGVLAGKNDEIEPLNGTYGPHIIGGAFFATPNRYANYPIGGNTKNTSNPLTATEDGKILGITNSTQYERFNTRFRQEIRDYCETGDRFCDKSSDPDSEAAGIIHQNAIEHWQTNATMWLKRKV